jgi:16S rRNA processing protein RimM
VVETVRPHAGGLLVRFAGIEDRTAAEQLGGVVLVGDSDSSPVIAELDEYWDHELIGLTVVTRQGEPVGEVTDVRHGAGGELLSVRRGDGGEVLVPFVTAMVPAVDLAGGVIVIDPPEGLLEL